LSLAGSSLISLRDLSKADIVRILDTADEMAKSVGFDDPGDRVAARPMDRIMAALFFEPSTRTRLSFESAMLRLGGQVIGFADASASSTRKGESLADTIRMAAAYCDIIVIRHPAAGAAQVAADHASVPVINGGDGPHEHPTQTLTDLFCIRRNKGTLEGLTVGLCGDLKYGRTVHSLAPVMARFGSQIVCISPEELKMPPEVLDEVEAIGGERPPEVATFEQAIAKLDVLYMTRVQAERFDDPAAYERVKGSHILTPEVMAQAGEQTIVLHPLPRVDEIAPAVDEDPRARYFQQAAGGVPVRMALISHLLGAEQTPERKGSFHLGGKTPVVAEIEEEVGTPEPIAAPGSRCPNAKCITQTESSLQMKVLDRGGQSRCYYCEQPL